MTLVLFEDACEPGVELIVELGLMTPTSSSAIWDVSLWDSAIWGTGPDRTDVSAYVRSFETDRSFSSDMRTWNAGSVRIVLDNPDGRFSPDNLEPGAPYVAAGLSGMRPGCHIWISMVYNGTTYPIFFGYVTDLDEGWALHGISPSDCNTSDPELLERTGDAIMTIVGVDDWGRLARQKKQLPVAPIGAGDTFGQRVSRILSAAGYTGPVTLGLGVITCQDTDLSTEVVTELNKVAQSEGGAIWDNVENIVAKGRYSLIEEPRSSTVQVAYGDNPDAGEIMWSDISVAPVSDEKIINHAVYARSGGTPQEYRDATSTVLYGVCDDDSQPTDLICETDAQVAGLAQWRVIVGKDPEARIEYIELKPRCDLALLAPLVLETQIRDLVSVRVRPPSAQHHYMYRECFISGIIFTVAQNDWTVRFGLSTATAYRIYSNSKWGSGTWGANDTDQTAARWFV